MKRKYIDTKGRKILMTVDPDRFAVLVNLIKRDSEEYESTDFSLSLSSYVYGLNIKRGYLHLLEHLIANHVLRDSDANHPTYNTSFSTSSLTLNFGGYVRFIKPDPYFADILKPDHEKIKSEMNIIDNVISDSLLALNDDFTDEEVQEEKYIILKEIDMIDSKHMYNDILIEMLMMKSINDNEDLSKHKLVTSDANIYSLDRTSGFKEDIYHFNNKDKYLNHIAQNLLFKNNTTVLNITIPEGFKFNDIELNESNYYDVIKMMLPKVFDSMYKRGRLDLMKIDFDYNFRRYKEIFKNKDVITIDNNNESSNIKKIKINTKNLLEFSEVDDNLFITKFNEVKSVIFDFDLHSSIIKKSDDFKLRVASYSSLVTNYLIPLVDVFSIKLREEIPLFYSLDILSYPHLTSKFSGIGPNLSDENNVSLKLDISNFDDINESSKELTKSLLTNNFREFIISLLKESLDEVIENSNNLSNLSVMSNILVYVLTDSVNSTLPIKDMNPEILEFIEQKQDINQLSDLFDSRSILRKALEINNGEKKDIGLDLKSIINDIIENVKIYIVEMK